jgi:predicted Zn-dependent protease
LFQQGSRYFIDQNYRDSIAPYRQALEIEKVTPTLEKNLWYVLVDNLALAYGVTDDFANAQRMSEYGISKDANDPLFYYNLACIAGEKGDVRRAKANFKLAYDRRAKALPRGVRAKRPHRQIDAGKGFSAVCRCLVQRKAPEPSP